MNEHHQNAYGTMPSPNLIASILARNTSRAALVVLGDSLALYNPPVRVAEEFAMLDVLSHGRLAAGFVVGTAMDSTMVYGIPPSTPRERYREAHDLIIRAWTAPGPFVFNGKYTRLRPGPDGSILGACRAAGQGEPSPGRLCADRLHLRG